MSEEATAAGRSTTNSSDDISRESAVGGDVKRLRNGLVTAEPTKTSSSTLNGDDKRRESRDDSLLTDLVVRLERCQVLAARLTSPSNAVNDNHSPAAAAAVTDDLSRLSVKDDSAVVSEERIRIVQYIDETQMGDIMRLITKDLSEPYSIYTYRYFIHKWPELCLLAYDTVNGEFVGSIVCKLDLSRQNRRRGYIAMLAVDENCRRLRIGTRLVVQAIENMQKSGCDEVVLETEVTNLNALRLYENLGFVREKRLFRYYLNGVDAFRLKLFLAHPPESYYFYDGGL